MATGTDVFISYASDTKVLAEALTKELDNQGIESWVDFKDLQPGQQWREALDRAIEKADWVLILVGSNSRTTPWQEAEWTAVLARSWADSRKRLLPVVFGREDPPPFLRNWVALRIDSDIEASTWTHKVVNVLRGTRSEAVDAGSDTRQERQDRYEEIRHAVEALREINPDTPPMALDSLK